MTTRRSRAQLALVVAAGLALYLVRVWPRVVRPTLWSEDGRIFLKQARESGVSAFGTTYQGYLHLVPRIIAAAGQPLPLSWQPSIYAVAASALGFGAALLVLNPRLAWLLPAPWQRQVLFLALIVAPSRSEVDANIANLISVGGIALLLLALANAPRHVVGRSLELVAIAVLDLNGPIGLLLVPVFVARWSRERTTWNGVLVITAAAAAIAQYVVLFSSNNLDTRDGSVATWGHFLVQRLVPTWLLGNDAGSHLASEHVPLAVAITVVVAAAVVVALFVVPSRWTAVALVVSLLAVTLAPSLVYGFFATTVRAPRHLIVPDAILLVVFVAALRAIVWRSVVAAVVLTVSLVGIVNDFVLDPRPFIPIGPAAACLRTQETCRVEVNPPVWDFELHPTS